MRHTGREPRAVEPGPALLPEDPNPMPIMQVVVTGDCGSATSRSARLVVVSAPVFTLQPGDLRLPFGATAQLQVDAVGTAPVTYWWQRGGVDLVGSLI